MQNKYWKDVKRNKESWEIDYNKEGNNTAIIITKFKNNKIHLFLKTLENKWLIRKENFELIYTAIVLMYRGTYWIVFEETFVPHYWLGISLWIFSYDN